MIEQAINVFIPRFRYLAGLTLFASLAVPQGPSFSCAHVTSQVNKLICASLALSALDRDLANVFENMRGQPLDQKQLRASENVWLKALQHDCSDSPCIEARYRQRIAQLRDQSLQVASRAAYAETRPFPVPSPILAQARSLLGKDCSFAGFSSPSRFLPVVLAGGVTVVKEKGGHPFAFLTVGNCQITDVVALPVDTVGDRFLQCAVIDPPLNGFGVRDVRTHGLEGFWAVNPQTQHIERVAITVLGIEKSVKCQQPEGGE